jgi:glycosyltransferase involved in cell wall biosynthesis
MFGVNIIAMGKISIVIPAFNEAESIGELTRYLLKEGGSALAEVIVSDGGSADATLRIAAKARRR